MAEYIKTPNGSFLPVGGLNVYVKQMTESDYSDLPESTKNDGHFRVITDVEDGEPGIRASEIASDDGNVQDDLNALTELDTDNVFSDTPASNIFMKACRNRVVCIGGNTPTGAGSTIGTVATAYRPKSNMRVYAVPAGSADASKTIAVELWTTGALSFSASSALTYGASFTLTYMI